jgi:hypothetical protein
MGSSLNSMVMLHLLHLLIFMSYDVFEIFTQLQRCMHRLERHLMCITHFHLMRERDQVDPSLLLNHLLT